MLVWKFPEPQAQQTNCASVHVKVADYGVSAPITIQGTYGLQGSEAYLPPEVVIYYGKKAYSTELDVYSYGMFMCTLMSLKEPFEDYKKQHVIDLLRDDIRPSLSCQVLYAFFVIKKIKSAVIHFLLKFFMSG